MSPPPVCSSAAQRASSTTLSKRRVLLIAASIVAAAILVVVGVVVVGRGKSTTVGKQPAPTTTTATAPSCGLPGTPGPAVTGATNARWDTQTGYPLPISTTDGPAKRDPAGPWSCFADTPSGAVLAAYIIPLRVAGVAANWQEVARQQTMPGAGQEALLAAGLGQTTSVTPRGFSVSAFSPDRATVAEYEHTGEGDFTCTIDVRWYQGDWRVELQDDGSTSTGCVAQVPDDVHPVGAMMCGPADPLSCVVSGAATDGLQALADSFGKGASWAVKTLMTAWLGTPSPDVTSAGSAATWLTGRLSYFVLVAAFASVLYAAWKMATSGSFNGMADLGGSLLRLIIVSGSVAFLTAGALQLGDQVAAWLIGTTPLTVSYVALFGSTTIPPALILLLGLVVILAQLVQFVLMLIKNAMVVALVAFIPLTAAASNSPTGRQGYQKALTWLVAFVAYKPVAAAIYALAFKLSDNSQGLTGQMSGIALMFVSIFALPAMMRLLAPVTASATGGNAGALAGATVGAAVATGAIVATGGAAAGAGGFAAAGGGGAGSGSAVIGAASSGPSGAAMVAGAMPTPSGSTGTTQNTTEEAISNE